MGDGGDAGGGLVVCPGEVGRLDPLLGVLEGVQVPGGKRRCRFDTDRHAGVFDDEEHLADPFVDVANEVSDRRLICAKGELSSDRAPDPHLVLEVGGDNAISFAERPVIIDQVFGDDEHRKAFGPGRSALASGEDEMDDVFVVVVLTRGDEPLHPFDVPHVALDVDGLGDPGADVRAGVRLGEHHRRAPVVVDHRPGETLGLLWRPLAGDHARHECSGDVEVDGRVGSGKQLGARPTQQLGGAVSAVFFGQPEQVPAAAVQGLHARLDRIG